MYYIASKRREFPGIQEILAHCRKTPYNDSMTEQIYYSDQYKKIESSNILRVDQLKKNYGIVLDRTIFYPEGGGQPGDTGFIGNTRIIDTRRKDGVIYHIAENEPEFKLGTAVECRLNWERRYDYMQQHTGQHILSGVMHNLFGIATVSIHQGEDYLTIETDREEIHEEEILAIEDGTNRIITGNVPVTIFSVDETKTGAMNLRRRPKVSGAVRLVQIEKYDIVACGGMHVSNTSEVRLTAWVGSEKIRGHARLIWKVGDRAVSDYREKTEIIKKLSNLFSTPQNSIIHAAVTRTDQFRDVQQTLSELENTIVRLRLAELEGHAGRYNGITVIIGDFSAERAGFLRNAVKKLPDDKPLIFCGMQKTGENELIWAIAANRDNIIDFPAVREKLFPIINAKGGGKPPVWQGKGSNIGGIDQFFEAFVNLIKES